MGYKLNRSKKNSSTGKHNMINTWVITLIFVRSTHWTHIQGFSEILEQLKEKGLSAITL